MNKYHDIVSRKMSLFIYSAILVGLMAGCSNAPVIKYVDRPVRVEIMVPAEIPEPPRINRPFLPVELLKPEHIIDPQKIARYYVKSIKLLEMYAAQLQCALDAYRTESEHQCTLGED